MPDELETHKVVMEFEVVAVTGEHAKKLAIHYYLPYVLPPFVADARIVAVDGEYLSHAEDLELKR
jgi:hypothetical protein